MLSLAGGDTVSFPEGTRTGDWFAIADKHPEMVPPSIAPVPYIEEPYGRAPRRAARVVAWLTVAATVAFLVFVGAKKPARREILSWGSFGLSERVLARTAR